MEYGPSDLISNSDIYPSFIFLDPALSPYLTNHIVYSNYTISMFMYKKKKEKKKKRIILLQNRVPLLLIVVSYL